MLRQGCRKLWMAGCVLSCMLSCSLAGAQSTELTSHDNHALLYAHQLGFSSQGMPNIRMRIADGLSVLRFTPKEDFVVMPAVSGGCIVKLKGGKTYEVTISNAKPGDYQYGAIVARSETPDGLKNAAEMCSHASIATENVPVGSVFALKGHVFDNRENLLMTKRTSDLVSTEALMKSVPQDSSVDGPEIYRELMTYPTASISLKDTSGNVQIEHQNLLWIELPDSGAVFHDIEGEDGKKNDMLLNAQIVVTPDQAGKLAVVQSADVETILRGIVPAEIFASAPEAALMAQSIAARTTLIAQAGTRHSADPWHVCNKQHCQVYRGLSGADPRTDKAIEKTRGQILFSDKKLVHSYYSAHCGGISAGSHETWGLSEKSYLVSRTDDAAEKSPKFKSDADFIKWWQKGSDMYCSGAPEGQQAFTSTKHARWDVRLTREELEALMTKAGKSVGQISDISVIERGASFRVTKLRITGTKGRVEAAKELPIRRLLGGLKSALFAMEIEKSGNQINAVHIYGAGFGHGVGLCQTGAIGMAQRGKTAQEILMHYYPGTRIETLW